jgi:DNA-binding response OmpR family regulator
MKFRLLATDPDPVLLQIYRAYFSTRGFEVTTAGDCVECLELLRVFLPDALILSLDLTWGGSDGVLAIIREETEMQPIPVVLTVGDISRTMAAELLLPPVVNLLRKPFRLRDLESIVEAALREQAVRQVAGAFDLPAVLASDDGTAATTSTHDKHSLKKEMPHV